jgi:hypothetical protein
MPAWQWQRRPTHAGDELAERVAAGRADDRRRLAELFGGRA